jgi:hypothetical protein
VIPLDATEVRARRVRITVMVAAVAASIGLAWVNTTAAKWCWLLIVVGPWAANRWAIRTRSGTSAAGAPGQ